MRKATCLLLAVLLCYSYATFAQNRLGPAVDSIRKEATINAIKNKLATPFGTSGLSNFISNINVSSSFKEGVNGKIELHTKVKEGWAAGLSLDQKIGSNDQEALPLSLTGFSPGTTVQLNVQKMFWNPSFNFLSDEQVMQLNEIEKQYARRNNIDDYRQVTLRDIKMNGTDEEKRMALHAFNTASQEPLFVNARAGFTKTSFTYSVDSIRLRPVTDAFITPTFSISLIKVLGSGFNVSGYVSLSYNYSIYYQGGSEYTFNIPFGNTNNYYTSTLTFGKAVKQTANTVTAEYRRNIIIDGASGKSSNIAISPSVNMDIDAKMLGVFLPVYFIKGADENRKMLNNLQGGIRFGYITNTEGNFASFGKGFIAQLIISAPLDFLDVL